MKHIKTLTAAAVSAVLLTGCLDSDDNIDQAESLPPAPAIERTDIRIIHASPDAPKVDVFSGTTAIGPLQDLDYQQGSAFFNLNAGDYTIRVEAETPGGNAEVLSADVSLASGTNYNVIAVGDVADLEAIIVTAPNTPVPTNTVRVQVLHAAPEAPEVDVYVTAPDAALADSQPVATLAFKDDAGPLEVPTGDYQIRITAAGTTTVVFDSGEVALGQSDLFIAATENVGPGDSPVSLVLATGSGSSVMLDADTDAEVRAIHGIADAPPVDIFAVVEDGDDIALFEGAPFKGVTNYIEVAGGDYVLDVAAAADNSIVAIDDAAITLTDGVRYTALANNTLAMADLDLIVDDGRPLATAAQVRIFHASQATGAVDIYVTDDGVLGEMVMPAFTGVEYNTGMLAETGYVQLAPGDYFVTVTPTGTQTAAIETGMLSLAAGGIYTAIAVDGDNADAGPQLILADDFVMNVPVAQQ